MNDLRRCLLDLDVAAIRALWAQQAHLPQPATAAEALASLHYARTAAESIPLEARVYSHRWLLDHDLPSGLPDELRHRAERLYPVVHEGVAIVVMGTSPLTREVAPLIRSAMGDAVEECYADGRREPEIVRPRMLEARALVTRQLLGVRV